MILMVLKSMKCFVSISLIANFILLQYGKEEFNKFKFLFIELLSSYTQEIDRYNLTLELSEKELMKHSAFNKNLEFMYYYNSY